MSKTCVICESELPPRKRKLCGSDECQREYDARKQRRYRQRRNRRKRNEESLREANKNMVINKPIVRYFGGKWRMAEFVMNEFPPHETYVEPFCGGANVFFRKPVHETMINVLNDLNGDIVNFFDVLRSRPDELVRAIQLTPFSRREYIRAYEPVENGDALERARRFYIRSWQSYGSGEGEYRTGWRYQVGNHRGTRLVDEWQQTDRLYLAAARLKSALIENQDALDCIRRYDSPQTLFYVDPPYVHSTRYKPRGYSHEMDDDQHRELADVLNSLQGMVVLSGYPSELYDELYSDWRCITKETKTNGNNDAVEAVWINPAADDVNKLPLFAS